MSVGITLEELLAWNQESSNFWKDHLDANPHLLELPCDIGGTANVQEFVRHIWGVELRWSQRLAGLPVTPKEDFPSGPLDALFDLHTPGRCRSSAVCWPLRRKAGSRPTCWTWIGCRRSSGPCRGARLLFMRSSTASAIGRNWLRSSARQGSPQGSKEICCSARVLR